MFHVKFISMLRFRGIHSAVISKAEGDGDLRDSAGGRAVINYSNYSI